MSSKSKPTKRYTTHINITRSVAVKDKSIVKNKQKPVVVRKCNCGKGFI